MGRRKSKTSGTRSCVCSVCETHDPSTVQNTKHRRCGGSKGAALRPKHAPSSGVRGVWT
jgi:hypothetical protein